MHSRDSTLKYLVNSLSQSVDDYAFEYVFLMDDILYKKIPEEQFSKIIPKSIEWGRSTACNIIGEMGSRDPFHIADNTDVEIKHLYEEKDAGVIRLSEYTSKPPTIILYQIQISRIENLVGSESLDPVQKGDIKFFLAAHELFHHLEETRIGSISKKYRIDTLRVGPLSLKSGILALSDIAADAFAKKLLELKYSPKLIYFISLYNYNREKAFEWLERLNKFKNETATKGKLPPGDAF